MKGRVGRFATREEQIRADAETESSHGPADVAHQRQGLGRLMSVEALLTTQSRFVVAFVVAH